MARRHKNKSKSNSRSRRESNTGTNNDEVGSQTLPNAKNVNNTEGAPIGAEMIIHNVSAAPQFLSRKAARKAARDLRAIDPTAATEIIKSRKAYNDSFAPPSNPLANFLYFPQLPIELRLQIYDYSIPCARFIEVIWKEKGDQYYTDSRTPVLLHICFESRRYAMRKYHKLEVENGWNTSKGIKPSSFGAYIDYTRDSLYFSLGNFHRGTRYLEKVEDFLAKLEPQNALSHLQNLAFDGEVIQPGGFTYPTRFVELSSLSTLELVVSDACLSFSNQWGKNPAALFISQKMQKRSINDRRVRRWDYSERKVLLASYINGPFGDAFGPLSAALSRT
ncbi:hypothetical protein EG329_002032 [Mollisiaceae sp. DMI_Dod_QoI]|nr:hypothetical protein EG329_002032 [Helotiales sp. DMI_Dod_QoI]